MANQILSHGNSNDKDENEKKEKNNKAEENKKEKIDKKSEKASKKDENTQLIVPDTNTQIDNSQVKVKKHIALKVIAIIFSIVIVLCIAGLTIFSVINNKDDKIKKGVTIEGVDVSELSKEEAKQKVQEQFLDTLDDTIYFQYGESQYSLALEQINVQYKLDETRANKC